MCMLRGTLPLVQKVWLSRIAKHAISPMAEHIVITNSSAEKLAIHYLKLGYVIAVPTDTVYGLACDATNVSAINKLYDIKCRNENKPLAICLSEVSDVKNWASVEHLPCGILKSLLPGPVTLIFRCTNYTLDKSLRSRDKIGIRIPNYNFIRCLSRGLGKPLALTSANLSDEPSAVEVSGFRSIWEKLKVIFDGGKLEYNNSASTVVDLTDLGTFTIVREGAACKETIHILTKFGLKNKY